MEGENIQKVHWKDVREKIAKVNSVLARTIDEISPDNRFPLYIFRYPYGSTIANHGLFHLPISDNEETIAINDSKIDEMIKDEFSYAQSGPPIGIIINNTTEESAENIQGEFVPTLIGRPGTIIWLWDRLDKNSIYSPFKVFSVTAGARCIFMLPNISDIALHRNLKRDFHVQLPPPKSILDHWDIFKAILRHPDIKSDWTTEIIFLPGSWLESMRKDRAWRPLLLLLYELAWERSAFERNQPTYELAFSKAFANRNLKPNPYIGSTFKHLFMLASGTFAGFGIATDDTYAPVSLIQKAYIESYGLRKYIPTIFNPMIFSLLKPFPPIYYSLNLPTTLESLPKARKLTNTLRDLSELNHILMIFKDEIHNERLWLDGTIIEKIVKEINFDFFHCKPDQHGEIKLTSKMIQEDQRFLNYRSELDVREVSETGAFIRGCVRISHENV